MKRLLAVCIAALVCTKLAAAEDPRAAQESVLADCTRRAAAMGYTGKELEDSIAKCVKIRRSEDEIDPAILAAMSSC